MNIGKLREAVNGLIPAIFASTTALVVISLVTGIRTYHYWGLNATIDVAILLAIGVISAVSCGIVLSKRNLKYWAVAACASFVTGIAIARFYPKIADIICLAHCSFSSLLVLFLIILATKKELGKPG